MLIIPHPQRYANWLTISTNFSDGAFDPSAWISQAEAARIRGVTRQAMHRLIQRGKLSTLEVGGHVLVSRIAQAAFELEVVQNLIGWQNITPTGDLPFDFMLADSIGAVKIQVKLQRSKEFRPMNANEAYRRFPADMYVVETQKTRGGKDSVTGESTRSYRFNEFDIIAVAMQPSKLDWRSYMYTVGNWLIPNDNDRGKILKFQPVSIVPNDDWTDDFEMCVSWLRSGISKTINSTSQ